MEEERRRKRRGMRGRCWRLEAGGEPLRPSRCISTPSRPPPMSSVVNITLPAPPKIPHPHRSLRRACKTPRPSGGGPPPPALSTRPYRRHKSNVKRQSSVVPQKCEAIKKPRRRERQRRSLFNLISVEWGRRGESCCNIKR